MKVRWNRESLRLRITPSEFAAITNGEAVHEGIAFPGMQFWNMTLRPSDAETTLASDGQSIYFSLSEADRAKLADPEAEGVYWDESAYYSFTSAEIDSLETATNECHRMAIEAVQHVIDTKAYEPFGLSRSVIERIEWACEAEPPMLYGRFDFVFDGSGEPKMLEYNADTPTSILKLPLSNGSGSKSFFLRQTSSIPFGMVWWTSGNGWWTTASCSDR